MQTRGHCPSIRGAKSFRQDARRNSEKLAALRRTAANFAERPKKHLSLRPTAWAVIKMNAAFKRGRQIFGCAKANALDQICPGTLDRLIEVLPVLGKPLASVEPNNGADGPPGDGTPEYDLDAAV